MCDPDEDESDDGPAVDWQDGWEQDATPPSTWHDTPPSSGNWEEWG